MKPIILLSSVEHQCVSFVWPHDLRYYAGYRFVEHRPRITPDALQHRLPERPALPVEAEGEMVRSDGWLETWQTAYVDELDQLPLRFNCFADGSATAAVVENGGLQERRWRFVPEGNGVRLWHRMLHGRPGRPGYTGSVPWGSATAIQPIVCM